MFVSGTELFRRAEHVNATMLPDGHCVLFGKADDRGGITLSPAGSIVWEFCDGKHSVVDIANVIKEISPTEDDSLLTDICTLVQELFDSKVGRSCQERTFYQALQISFELTAFAFTFAKVCSNSSLKVTMACQRFAFAHEQLGESL